MLTELILLLLLVDLTSALADYDPELRNITLADERAHVDTVYTSVTGAAIAATSGAISAVSSLTIIYLIGKSRTGLGTVYHRLMFALSIFEVILSVAIAFTTLPMPRDMIYDQFKGPVLGNTNTCSAQGFLFILGTNSASAYNCFLLVYYLLTIRYKMDDAAIKKVIEPTMHGYAIVFGLCISGGLLVFDAFNPTPLDAWCTAMTIPFWCPGLDEPCLLRGSKKSYIIRNIMLLHYMFMGIMMIGSLLLVVWTVYSQESLFALYNSHSRNIRRPDNQFLEQQLKHDFFYTKKIFKQAMAYFIAYVLVNIFPLITIVSGGSKSTIMSIAHLCIRPSQGEFNLLIFLYHKVDNSKRSNQNITLCSALRQIFKGDEEQENIISTLYLVRCNEQQEEQDDQQKNSAILHGNSVISGSNRNGVLIMAAENDQTSNNPPSSGTYHQSKNLSSASINVTENEIVGPASGRQHAGSSKESKVSFAVSDNASSKLHASLVSWGLDSFLDNADLSSLGGSANSKKSKLAKEQSNLSYASSLEASHQNDSAGEH